MLYGRNLKKLTILKYDDNRHVHEHISQIFGTGTFDNLLVHWAFYSLPNQFSQLNVTHNTSRKKLGVNKQLSVYVDEMGRLKGEE